MDEEEELLDEYRRQEVVVDRSVIEYHPADFSSPSNAWHERWEFVALWWTPLSLSVLLSMDAHSIRYDMRLGMKIKEQSG